MSETLPPDSPPAPPVSGLADRRLVLTLAEGSEAMRYLASALLLPDTARPARIGEVATTLERLAARLRGDAA